MGRPSDKKPRCCAMIYDQFCDQRMRQCFGSGIHLDPKDGQLKCDKHLSTNIEKKIADQMRKFDAKCKADEDADRRSALAKAIGLEKLTTKQLRKIVKAGGIKEVIEQWEYCYCKKEETPDE